MSTVPNQPTPVSPALALSGQDAPDDQPLGRKEKERMALQYIYKWWELFWDKLIFAAFLALFGAAFGTLGYCVVNRHLENQRTKAAEGLEKFRTNEAGKQALLQKRLPELFTINSAMSEVTRVYFSNSGGRKADDEQKVRDEYKAALAKLRESINRSPFLFDLDFNKDLDRYYAVHSKMSRLPTEKWGKYQDFAFDLSNNFDDLCRSVIEGQRDDPKTRMHMPLSPMSSAERERLSPEQCVEAYRKYWEDSGKP